MKDLKEKLNELPDNAIVLLPAHDCSVIGSYRNVTEVSLVTALLDVEHGGWLEDYGEDATPEAQFGRRKKVVVID